ncbi:TPA: YiaA/YiaB family inner membrane protein, partial [Bacillus anthracis]
MRRRNTQAFTFLAWTSFVCALSGMLIGIYTL